MTDIHTHILPFVDDGSESLEDSITMLLSEVSGGVDTVYLTPHHNLHRGFVSTKEELIAAFDSFKAEVEKRNIPVKLKLGQEICYCEEENIVAAIQLKHLLTLGDTNNVLLEFDFYEQPYGVLDKIAQIIASGYSVIIAHVERYEWISVSFLKKLKKLGCELQINTESLANDYPKKSFIKRIIKAKLIDWVASDIHSFRPVDWQSVKSNPLMKNFAFRDLEK